MKHLLLMLVLPCLAFAENISGSGVNPLTKKSLNDFTTLEIIAKEDTQTIGWKLTRTTETSSSSISSGQGAGEGERFVYFWDEAAHTFWFAGPRYLEKITLEGKNASGSITRTTKGFEHYDDLPEQFRVLLENTFNTTPSAPSTPPKHRPPAQ